MEFEGADLRAEVELVVVVVRLYVCSFPGVRE